jgi:hypothetical protein
VFVGGLRPAPSKCDDNKLLDGRIDDVLTKIAKIDDDLEALTSRSNPPLTAAPTESCSICQPRRCPVCADEAAFDKALMRADQCERDLNAEKCPNGQRAYCYTPEY